MANLKPQIPPSVLRLLQEVPGDKPVAVLMRHSLRSPLSMTESDFLLPITEAGVQIAKELGQRLRGRLRSLHTSPVARCVQTAEALLQGANLELAIQRDQLLGHPGAYVIDGGIASRHWQERGQDGMMEYLVREKVPLEGMAAPEEAARLLVEHMLCASSQPGLHLFLTHDSLLTATVSQISGVPLPKADWPSCLEAAFFWKEKSRVHLAYRTLK